MLVDQNSTLAEFYTGWQAYQQNLIKAIAPLTDEKLALRAAPQLRSVLNIAQHLIAVRVRWFYEVAGAGTPDIAPIGTWDRPDAPSRTAAELVEGLEISWKMISEALARWTQPELEQPFIVEDKGQQYTFTRKWIVWHVIEHDLHHGGEISFSLGMHGVPVVLID